MLCKCYLLPKLAWKIQRTINNIPVKEYNAQNCDVAFGSGMFSLFSCANQYAQPHGLFSASGRFVPELGNDLVNQYSKLCYRSSLNSLTKSSNDLEVGRPATAPPRPPHADPRISTKPAIATAPNGISRCKLPADKPFMVPRERSVRSINTNLQR